MNENLNKVNHKTKFSSILTELDQVASSCVSDIESRIGVLLAEEENLKKRIEKLEKENETAQAILEETKRKNEIEISNLETEKSKWQIKYDEMNGDLSRKETWLENKEKQLRKAKLELEEYFGRPIKHVKL
jgi:chromosome segregation ATPase